MMVYMYLACTYLYMLYIYSTNRFAGHGKEKVLELLLENCPLCHAMALERTLSDDALKQTLKAITLSSV